MSIRVLTKEDLWCTVLGGSALSTGGGGAPPSYEDFSKIVDRSIEKGHKFRLADAKTMASNKLIFISAGIGGGLQREKAEKYLRRYTSVQEWIREMDRVFPLPSWAEVPDDRWQEATHRRMVELKGDEPYGFMPFEAGPNNYREFLIAGEKGKVVVDADTAGHRAVPEVSLSCLNVVNAPLTPVVVTTSWGDLAVFEKLLSWQRCEDLLRHIAVTSGGGCASIFSFDTEWIKKGTDHGSLTLSMSLGRSILDARNKGKDPVEAIVKAGAGYRLFEGEIAAYTNEGHDSFTWGNAWIKGGGNYSGHTMKIWFQNENQISWLDDVPFVTCPDPFTVLDVKTGEGLSNFNPASWIQGRKVAVWGLRAAAPWRTERGLKIYNPKHFGFDISYKPIEDVVEKVGAKFQ